MRRSPGGAASGFCRSCYPAEFELGLIEEQSKLGRDEILNLIAESLAHAESPGSTPPFRSSHRGVHEVRKR